MFNGGQLCNDKSPLSWNLGTMLISPLAPLDHFLGFNPCFSFIWRAACQDFLNLLPFLYRFCFQPWISFRPWTTSREIICFSLIKGNLLYMACIICDGALWCTLLCRQMNISITQDTLLVLVWLMDYCMSAFSAGFLDQTGDEDLAWSSCFNHPDNIGYERSSGIHPKI